MSDDQPSRVLHAPFKSTAGRGSDLAPTPRPPAWGYWKRLKSTLPWKLAALSLGIEPASIDPQEEGTFPDAATFGRFNLIAEAVKRRFGAHDTQHVKLGEFIAWAVSVSLEMPPELHALADAGSGGEAPPAR